MKINHDIMSTYILISNFMKINQDIIVFTGLLLGSHIYPLLAWSNRSDPFSLITVIKSYPKSHQCENDRSSD